MQMIASIPSPAENSIGPVHAYSPVEAMWCPGCFCASVPLS